MTIQVINDDGTKFEGVLTLDQLVKLYLLHVLSVTNNNILATAKLLDITRETVYNKIWRWNIDVPGYRPQVAKNKRAQKREDQTFVLEKEIAKKLDSIKKEHLAREFAAKVDALLPSGSQK